MGTKFEVLYVGWEDRVKFSEVVKTLFLCLADKDVARTDRQTDFYSEANHPNLTKLYDILLTYCMYNFDLGESYMLSALIIRELKQCWRECVGNVPW